MNYIHCLLFARKQVDESNTVFRGRLEMSLLHYLKVRKVTKFEELVYLCVAVRLKDCLSTDYITLCIVFGRRGMFYFW